MDTTGKCQRGNSKGLDPYDEKEWDVVTVDEIKEAIASGLHGTSDYRQKELTESKKLDHDKPEDITEPHMTEKLPSDDQIPETWDVTKDEIEAAKRGHLHYSESRAQFSIKYGRGENAQTLVSKGCTRSTGYTEHR